MSWGLATHHEEERVYRGWHPSLVQIYWSVPVEDLFGRDWFAKGSAEDLLMQLQKTAVGSRPSFKEDLQMEQQKTKVRLSDLAHSGLISGGQ